MKIKSCFIIILAIFGTIACKEPQADVVNKETQYTCPMHPQIVEDAPGTCPVCHMDLVLFDRNNESETIMLSAEQQLLANIKTSIMGTSDFEGGFSRLNGRVSVDPSATAYMSAKVPGRIENLFVKESGILVKKGQPVYKIYAEILATLQQEYLLALEQVKQFPGDEHFKQIVQAAKQKLLLYHVTENQLQVISRQGKADPYVTVYAPASGLVADLSVTEGQYVEEGSLILRLEDYSKVWIEADVYGEELANIEAGNTVVVSFPGGDIPSQNMKIQFVSPSYIAGSQVSRLRGTVDNAAYLLKPGQQANILLPSGSVKNALTLPIDAVIRNGKGKHIWIEKEQDVFEPRAVITGLEHFNKVEISSGLTDSERVVISGAYLLYSEYVLRKGREPFENSVNN